MRRAFGIVIAAAAVLLTASCSSGDESDGAAVTPSAPAVTTTTVTTTITPTPTATTPVVDNSPCPGVVTEGIGRPVTDRVGVTCDEATRVSRGVVQRDPSKRVPQLADGSFQVSYDGWTCTQAPRQMLYLCERGSSSFTIN